MMIKLKFLPICLLIALSATAQQKPYYTQYILNNYILNPALSGIENYTDVKLSYRDQWNGIPGAPVTTYFSIQGPIGPDDRVRQTATTFDKAGTNVTGSDAWQDNVDPVAHQGAGLIAVNDKTGYINRFSVYGTYAYHKPLGQHLTLSAGFQAGITNISIDASKITTYDPLNSDNAIIASKSSLKKLLPEVGAGLWLYSKQAFLGLSVLNIVPGKVQFGLTPGTYFEKQYFLSTGYKFYLNGEISCLPSIQVQFLNPDPVQIHTNVKFQYQDLLWFGASFRTTDKLGGFAAMAGFNINHSINIGYAYDMSTDSRLRNYAQDTHEIIIGFLLNNKYGDSCPRNVW